MTIDIPLAVESMCLAGLLALGVGTFNSVLFVAFPVYATIYGVLTRPLFLASGVFFQLNTMPDFVQRWESWNPTAMPVSLMRKAFYPGADVSLASPGYRDHVLAHRRHVGPDHASPLLPRRAGTLTVGRRARPLFLQLHRHAPSIA